jgi:putative hydrolase of the HAD superfamily
LQHEASHLLRNIVFDLGGVVLEWKPDAIIEAVFDDPITQAHIRAEIFEHPDWLETDRGTLTRVEAIVRWAERTGQTVEAIDRLMDAADNLMQPNSGTLNLMKELANRGLRLYCLSNMPAERYAYLRRAFDFWDQFSGILISAHVNMVKPEPGIFELLLARFDLESTATLFLDDSANNISAARGLGIRGIRFTTATDCRRQLERLL